MTQVIIHLPPPPSAPPLVGDPAREKRRAGVSTARICIRRRSNFHGWLQTTLLRKHDLTDCGCGLINCR